MFKGSTKIELKDVSTGDIKVIEKENLVTNALLHQLKVFSSYYDYGTFNEVFGPFAEKAMGGIKLFNNTIEEDPNNYYLPNIETHSIVGYASADTTDGTDNRRGSRNQFESQEIAGGYQFVWDFATTEANGTIQSLALTHSESGQSAWYPYGKENAFFKSATSSLRLAEIDFEQRYYVLISCSDYTISVEKYAFYYDKIDLSHKLFTSYQIAYDTIPISFPVNASLFFQDGKDGYWYTVYTSSNSIYVGKLHKETLAFSYDTITISEQVCTTSTKYNWAVYEGYVYIAKDESHHYYGKGFFKVNLANHADISIIDFDEWERLSYDLIHITPVYNGMLFANGILFSNNAKEIFFENYGIIKNKDYFGSINSSYFKEMCNIRYHSNYGVQVTTRYANSSSYDSSLVPDKTVLMTINNLPEPIIKTADKTMKIIYTITYVEEENDNSETNENIE